MAAKKYVLALTFLGTRGEIEVRSRQHGRHSALLVEHNNVRIMIDCGADWLGRLHAIAPTAILLTHAHPDHAGGLAEGAPCPVYATDKTQRLLSHFPIRDRRQSMAKPNTEDWWSKIQGVSGPAFHPRARSWISRVCKWRHILLPARRRDASETLWGAARGRPLYR